MQGEKLVQVSPPSPRKERWVALNQCLEASEYSKESRNGEISTPYFPVRYDEVKEVYEPITQSYRPDIKSIPDDDFDLLVRVLGIARTTFGPRRGDAKRLYFIADILTVVCNLFNGDVRIKVEQDLIGKNVNANAHCEFVLERGKKRVCIVQAKSGRMEQGLAECLIGCEILSDLNDLRVVHGIVTTFELWTFLRSCDDKIEEHDTMLSVENGLADSASLKNVAGKIYAMLSDDD
jgi:hypothetical protein